MIKTAIKWIRQRQDYSSPVFALLLMVNVFILPSYRAAAQIEEPVQPMAQTAEQVIDALNAVEAGVEVDKAFNAQPLPYRDLAKEWKQTYEELFQVPYPPGGDPYLLDLEIDSNLIDFTPFQGHTALGQVFEVEIVQLIEPDYFQDEITDADRAMLDSVANNSLGVIASVQTANTQIFVLGVLMQWDFDEVTRVHELVILDRIPEELLEEFRSMRDLHGVFLSQQPVLIEPSPELSPCERCLQLARNEHERRMGHILVDLNFAIAGIVGLFALRGIHCLRLSFTPFVGLGLSLGCLALAAAAATVAMATAGVVAERARQHANVDLDADLLNCCISHEDCCDTSPV